MAISKRKSNAVTKKRTLVAYTHPESIISEQYRMIQANINFSMSDNRSRSFLITSPNKGEGKSTTAVNLAISMAQQKDKVLLIDANLRNPNLHSIFNIPNSGGLTDILMGRTSLFDAVNHTKISRLDVVTSGTIPMNPVELLSSPFLPEVLVSSLKSYDVVLIDSHSVLELTDTKLLANQCDGVVLVIQKGKTLLDKAVEAKKVLEFAKATLIGVVMNEY